MVRFPFMLEMWYEEEAVLNPDGSPGWTEGVHEWRIVGRCNVLKLGQAVIIKGLNGETSESSYKVILPPPTKPISIGTKVRIFNAKGINFFSGHYHDDKSPKEDPIGWGTCKDFDPFKQKYEDKVMWL